MATPNFQPIFIRTPLLGIATLTSEVIGRGGTNMLPPDNTLLLTAGSTGAFIENIEAIPVADGIAITQSVLRIFRKKADDSALIMCCPELSLPAIASSPANIGLVALTVPLFPVIIGPSGTLGLRVGPNESIYCALGTALVTGAYNVVASGGFYS